MSGAEAASGLLKRTGRSRGIADIALAVLVVAIVATMIVPLPLFVLDVLLTVNLSLSVVLLLVALYVPEALGIASFPTILLVTTLYRLSLDIAATRLILGRGDAGQVIRAFGLFVVHGNYVVGAVIFVILTIVQFLVIAKGGERVAEVAARFALDAMPGKQMAIDAELRAGAIDQNEARRRRRMLTRESSFYGAMDGAMKFVKGDAIAGIIIACVNIAGGLAIGVLQRGMSVNDALQRYGLLTIGEGLVAQIPALIISTAAGILVTRVASEEPDQSLGKEIASQIVGQPRALLIAGVLLAVFALTPGMPTVPFMIIAVLLLIAGRAVQRAQSRRARRADVIGSGSAGPPGAAREAGPDSDRDALSPAMTPITVEVGEGLAHLVESQPGKPEAALRALIPAMRDHVYRDTGVPFPGVRVRVLRGEVAPRHFVIRLHEVPAYSADLPEGRRLVASGIEQVTTRGLHTIEDIDPVTGAPTVWVEQSAAASLEADGCVVLAPEEVVVVALGAALTQHAALFVGIQETQRMLDALEQTHPALVRNVVPKPLSVPLLADVLRRIAEERISIRDLRGILEGLASVGTGERDPVVLADLARQSLRRQITHAVAPDGRLRAWLISPDVTDAVRDSIARTPTGNYLRLDPQLSEEIRETVFRRLGARGGVLLTDADVRRYVWVLLEPRCPRIMVLSHAELMPGTLVESLGSVG